MRYVPQRLCPIPSKYCCNTLNKLFRQNRKTPFLLLEMVLVLHSTKVNAPKVIGTHRRCPDSERIVGEQR